MWTKTQLTSSRASDLPNPHPPPRRHRRPLHSSITSSARSRIDGGTARPSVQTLFLRAARVVGDRNLDLPTRKMENSGVPPQQTAKIRGFVPVGRSDRASLYDESLPPSLVLGQDDAGH
jgi:hypothetical protein